MTGLSNAFKFDRTQAKLLDLLPRVTLSIREIRSDRVVKVNLGKCHSRVDLFAAIDAAFRDSGHADRSSNDLYRIVFVDNGVKQTSLNGIRFRRGRPHNRGFTRFVKYMAGIDTGTTNHVLHACIQSKEFVELVEDVAEIPHKDSEDELLEQVSQPVVLTPTTSMSGHA